MRKAHKAVINLKFSSQKAMCIFRTLQIEYLQGSIQHDSVYGSCQGFLDN